MPVPPAEGSRCLTDLRQEQSSATQGSDDDHVVLGDLATTAEAEAADRRLAGVHVGPPQSEVMTPTLSGAKPGKTVALEAPMRVVTISDRTLR